MKGDKIIYVVTTEDDKFRTILLGIFDNVIKANECVKLSLDYHKHGIWINIMNLCNDGKYYHKKNLYFAKGIKEP